MGAAFWNMDMQTQRASARKTPCQGGCDQMNQIPRYMQAPSCGGRNVAPDSWYVTPRTQMFADAVAAAPENRLSTKMAGFKIGQRPEPAKRGA